MTGTPDEVALVRSILSGLNAHLTSINVGNPPTGVPLTPVDGGAWLTMAYPAALSDPVRTEARWESQEILDAYAVRCKTAGVPCNGGFTVVSDAGDMPGDFSTRFTPSDRAPSPSQSTQALSAMYETAAAAAGLTDVRVTAEAGAGPRFIVTATAADPKAFFRRLGDVIHAADGPDGDFGVLLRVNDAHGDAVMVVGNSDDASSTWVSPTWIGVLQRPIPKSGHRSGAAPG